MKAGINMGFEKRQTIDFVIDSFVDTIFELIAEIAPEVDGWKRAKFVLNFAMDTYYTWDNWTWAE